MLAARRIIQPWLAWSVFAIALKRTSDIELSVRTAQCAVEQLWEI